MKKLTILSLFVCSSLTLAAQSEEPRIFAQTKQLTDTTALLIDTADHNTCEGCAEVAVPKTGNRKKQVHTNARPSRQQSSHQGRRRNTFQRL